MTDSTRMKPIEMTTRHIEAFRMLFVCREDRYGCQVGSGDKVHWRAVESQITLCLIRKHLEGRKTIGGYSAVPGSTKHLVFDFDSLHIAPVLRLKAALLDSEVEGCIEFSGCKGWHLWVFFQQMVPNSAVRGAGRAALAQAGLANVEMFPKQDVVSEERPGSLIKFPAGVHQATGKRCVFVDEEGRPHGDQFDFILSVKRTSLAEFREKLGLSDVEPNRHTGEHFGGPTPQQLKPCVEGLLRSGAEEGYRNEAGFLAACELRRIGVSKTGAGAALSTWNLRNNPPLRRDELQQILASAYSPEARYEFGCNWDGTLAEIMPQFCMGKEECLYIDLLKLMRSRMTASRTSTEKGGQEWDS